MNSFHASGKNSVTGRFLTRTNAKLHHEKWSLSSSTGDPAGAMKAASSSGSEGDARLQLLPSLNGQIAYSLTTLNLLQIVTWRPVTWRPVTWGPVTVRRDADSGRLGDGDESVEMLELVLSAACLVWMGGGGGGLWLELQGSTKETAM